MMSSSRSSAAVAGSFPHPEVVDDQQRHGLEAFEQAPAAWGAQRPPRVLQEHVPFTVEHAVPVRLDDRPGDHLGDVALTGPRRPQEECVLAAVHEAPGRYKVCGTRVGNSPEPLPAFPPPATYEAGSSLDAYQVSGT